MSTTPEFHRTPRTPDRTQRHLEIVPRLPEVPELHARPEAPALSPEALDVVLASAARQAAGEFLQYDPHKTLVRTIRTTTAVTEGWCIPGQTPSFVATYLSTEGLLAGVPQGSYDASWLALPTLHNDDLAAIHQNLEDERKARRIIHHYRTT